MAPGACWRWSRGIDGELPVSESADVTGGVDRDCPQGGGLRNGDGTGVERARRRRFGAVGREPDRCPLAGGESSARRCGEGAARSCRCQFRSCQVNGVDLGHDVRGHALVHGEELQGGGSFTDGDRFGVLHSVGFRVSAVNGEEDRRAGRFCVQLHCLDGVERSADGRCCDCRSGRRNSTHGAPLDHKVGSASQQPVDRFTEGGTHLADLEDVGVVGAAGNGVRSAAVTEVAGRGRRGDRRVPPQERSDLRLEQRCEVAVAVHAAQVLRVSEAAGVISFHEELPVGVGDLVDGAEFEDLVAADADAAKGDLVSGSSPLARECGLQRKGQTHLFTVDWEEGFRSPPEGLSGEVPRELHGIQGEGQFLDDRTQRVVQAQVKLYRLLAWPAVVLDPAGVPMAAGNYGTESLQVVNDVPEVPDLAGGAGFVDRDCADGRRVSHGNGSTGVLERCSGGTVQRVGRVGAVQGVVDAG